MLIYYIYCLFLKIIDFKLYNLYFRSIELKKNDNANMCVRTAKAEKRMKERLSQEVNILLRKKKVFRSLHIVIYLKNIIYLGNCIK